MPLHFIDYMSVMPIARGENTERVRAQLENLRRAAVANGTRFFIPAAPHRHTATSVAYEPFTGPVTTGAFQHGGICRVEVCICGLHRRVNVNGRHREEGPWTVERCP